MGINRNKTRSPLTFRQEKDNRWLSATKQNNFWVCRIAWNGFRVFGMDFPETVFRLLGDTSRLLRSARVESSLTYPQTRTTQRDS